MDWRQIVDAALEVTVVGSFTRIGPAIRRRLFRWREPPPSCLVGKTALVTGPTSGLGLATARGLAAVGARVVLVGRNGERLARLRDELTRLAGEDRFPMVVADMASLASVRRAVEQVRATENRLDLLVDNAGAIYPEWTLSADGIEATLALLVVGPFALMGGLLPLMRASGDARVIAVASGGMYTQAVDLDDLQSRNGAYSGALAYARAKRIQVALVREWARRLAGGGIAVNAMHPGWADTPGLASSLPGFHRLMRPLLRTPQEGIDTILWLATTQEQALPTGKLYLDRAVRPFDRVPGTRLAAADRRALWDAVVELSGGYDPARG
jgi:NAD(P)-dependent dehydrogenase (short-subunit alcohol dehydrogenase family)